MSFPQTPGDKLTPEDQRYVLAAYVHRYTGEHTPAWATQPRPDGGNEPYPVQFSDDADWLRHTKFATRRDGRLDLRVHASYSTPTWPYNPELRACKPQSIGSAPAQPAASNAVTRP